MKKLLSFLICFLPWLISGFIFKYNALFYENLILPKFTLSPKVISFIWILLYILIAISIYKVKSKHNIFKCSDYFYVLITNYLANQLFCYVFFNLMSPLFGFIMCTVTLVSSVFLFIESRNLEKGASYFLIPYIIYSVYAFVLSLVIYIINF